MDERVVYENEAPGAGPAHAAFIQDGVVNVVEEVVDDGPFGKLIGEIDPAGNRAGGIARIVGAVRVAMDVHEDVALDPCVRAVEVEVVVGGPVEDVVDVERGVVPANGRAAARVEIDIGQSALDGRVDKIEAAPVAASGHVCDVDALRVRALRQNPTRAIDGDRRPGSHVNCRSRL